MTQIPDYQTPPTGDAQSKIAAPAITLMILGGLYILLSLLSLILNIAGAGIGMAGGGDEAGQAIFSGALGVVFAIFGLILGAIILFGAMKMRKLQSYTFSMIATIAAMLPCTCCCIIGLPVGIWALIVLLKPEVKAAFQG